MGTVHELLEKLNACEDAREWASNHDSIEEMVQNVERGDWMLWLAKKIGVELKPLTLAKARCAKTVIHLMKDKRSIDAVNIAEKFGMTDEVSLDDLKYAADAAYDAYTAADYAAYAAADYAAYAAADYAAYAAADYAADYAAYAAADAYAADYAAYAAAYDAAYKKNQKQTTDICREVLGKIIIEKVNGL